MCQRLFNIFAQSDIYREYRHWPSRPHIALTSTLKWPLGNRSFWVICPVNTISYFCTIGHQHWNDTLPTELFPDKLSSLRADEGRSTTFSKAWSDFKSKCHWSLQGTHCVISVDVLRSPLIVRLWHCSCPSWPAQVRSKFTSQSHHYQWL